MKARREKRTTITHFLDGVGVSLRDLTLLSKCGEIDLYVHPELGRVFVISGEVQHVEAWAPLYHEPLVHLPASFVSEVKDVLILGGGTLYAAQEALKYKSVRRVHLVDSNPTVLQMAHEYYDHAKKILKDVRLTVSHDDAYSALEGFQREFDLVLNDGSPLLPLNDGGETRRKSDSAFAKMTRVLKPGGVCADVVHRHIFELKSTLETLKALRRNSRIAFSLVFIPEYHGVLHALVLWGSKASAVSQTQSISKNGEQKTWAKKPACSPCGFFDPRFLQFYFYVPAYLKRALGIRKKAA